MNRDLILIVDDEPAILETYCDYLTPPQTARARVKSSRLPPSPPPTPAASPRYGLLLARSGEQAVEMVRAEIENGGRIACGFFDMRMPGGIDGLETIRRARVLDPQILVAIVTAYQDRSLDEIATIFSGGHEDEWDYLNKPFTEPEIAQKARNLVSSWHRRRREEHYLGELMTINQTLEDRVRERTEALEQKAADLERALDEVQSTQRQLVHKERLAAIGQLCAGLAHEINTPATYALLDVQHLIAEDAVRDQGMRDILRNAREGLKRIAEISRELRVFGQNEAGAREEVDLDEVVERALRMVSRALHAQGDVLIRKGSPARVLGDAGQLVQVVVVLLLNAAQALDPRRRDQNLVVVGTEDRGDHAVIRVSDNGVGIPAEQVDRVFEPFFTTRAAFGGLGLGLSVCRRLVENHGGTVRVESTVSRGTSFDVLLPAAPRPAAVPQEALAIRPRDGAPRIRLLVIDDDAHLLKSYRRWLSLRYDVETAEGAAPALAALERGETFDAILCDVMMPGVSGIELFRALHERWPAAAARVVFMTGGTFTAAAQRDLEATARPCLMKPFDLDDLDVCLSEALAE